MLATLYVYYRPLRPDDALATRIAAMQQQLAGQYGIQARLLERMDDATTWMEVYEGIADTAGFSRHLQQRLAVTGLECATGPRHTEWFIPRRPAPRD